MKKVFLLGVLILLMSPILVFAEGEDTTCNYNSKAYLNKIAASVKMAYQFKYDDDGNVSFDISVYNIKEDIYVILTDNMGMTKEIFASMTTGGTYTFNTKDVENIVTYTATIRTLKFGCINDIRKITVIKPKKNEISDNYLCSNEYAKNSVYCEEWINQEFSISESEALEIIENEILKQESANQKPTAEEEEIEKNKQSDEKKKKMKQTLIRILIVGILIDLITIIVMTLRIRRYEI